MKDAIKLISVNIEREKHLDLVKAFIQKEQPDIVCLQEVFKSDFKKLEETLGMVGFFGNMGNFLYDREGKSGILGVGMLSALPLQNSYLVYYHGDERSAKDIRIEKDEDVHKYYRVLAYGTVVKGRTSFTIGTTHFTWSPNGQANDVQREHLRKLLKVLKDFREIVFCGDFNAPRGGEIFDTISKHYIDHIPKEYTTSIDVNLHHLGEKLRGKPLLVDGLFSTPHYKVENVRLVDGVSDHLAIVAEITK